jgi:hypothetical protein
MASLGAAELTAAHIAGADLPEYASSFALARYDDPAYLARVEDWGPSSQL